MDVNPNLKIGDGNSCAVGSVALLGVAVTLDPITTYVFVRAGVGEGHPLWASLIELYGLVPAMGVRALAGLIIVALVVLGVRSERVPITRSVPRVLTGVFLGISIWNIAMASVAWRVA